MAFTRTEKLVAVAFALALGCSDDTIQQPSETETSGDGDGDSGDGDGDSGDGDGDSGDGDGDGEPGDGDGDDPSTCPWSWEVTQMKMNGQTHAALDVEVAPNGEFVAVGRLENASNDAWIGRFSPAGELLWEQLVNGGGSAQAAALTFDDAGDIVMIGSSGDDLWIHERGPDGSEGWTVDVVSNFDGESTPGDIALAPDGSLVVTAAIRAGVQDTDIWVRKLSATDGSEAWTTTYSGATDENGFSIDRGNAVAVAADGTIYVGGAEGVNFETREGVLLAYEPDGDEGWKLAPRADGTPHLHEGGPVATGPEGEIYFVVSTPAMVSAFWLYRVTPSGDIEWEQAEDYFKYGPTNSWRVAGLDARGSQLTIGGTFLEEEIGQSISWANVWVANVDFAGQGLCIDSHTWQNVHIIPASTHAYGLSRGPNGTVAVGEILDGPENYLWVGGFE